MSACDLKKESGRCRAHLIVQGRVQGVGYRAFTQREAMKRQVCGWVGNLPDGRVEAEAEGEQPQVLEFIERLKAGPTFSRIEHIDIDWVDALSNEDQFVIKY